MTLMPQSSKYFQPLFFFLALGIVCFFTLQLAWTGFVSSDDAYYVQAGLNWLEQFPYVAHHFGTIRASVAIPIAFVVYLIGESELSVTLSTAMFFVATVAISMFMLSNILGRLAAFVACGTLLSLPLFALKATIPCADIPELFFVVLSFWLFWQACFSTKRVVLLLISGIAAGLAFSAHELTAALILFYGVLFLRGYKLHRREYLWMAVGFLLVTVAEGLYYWIAAGNPAHRFMVLLQATTVQDRVNVGFLEIAAGGTLHIWGPIDPIVMLLSHHDFGVLGWLSIPAVFWLLVYQRKTISRPVALARLALGLGTIWCVVSAVLLREMILLPRYYMVTAYCLFIVCAVWISVGLWPRSRKLTIGMVIIVLVANLLSILVDNKNPKFSERALVGYLKQTQGLIYTDPLTAHNSYWYCRWEHVDCSRIVPESPKNGDLYFWNPKNTNSPTRFVQETELEKYRPRKSWEPIWSNSESPGPIANVLQWGGLAKIVPTGIWNRLSQPNPTVKIYRVHD